MSIHSKIKSIAESNQRLILEARRHIHSHPELSYEEHETAQFISDFLTKHGIAHETGVADTGLVVDLKGAADRDAILLRADIDALPIQELNKVDYASTKKGIMHACGHDVHTSCLLGAILILDELRDEWKGTVRCLFQPGEEKLPGGASLMIKAGVLEGYDFKAIIGQHVFPDLPAGTVGFRPGMYMASADEIFITVKGQGGHGATPHLNRDPVVAASQVIVALQEVVSRFCPATIPSVLSFGKVEAMGATNVIPDEVRIAGTFRTMNEEWRAQAHEHIKRIAQSTAAAFDTEAIVDIPPGYPFLKNDEELTHLCIEGAQEFVGAANVEALDIRMTAEDFSYYSHHVPACFYRLGTGSPNGQDFKHSVHTPYFDIDEDALVTGSSMMAALALKCLS